MDSRCMGKEISAHPDFDFNVRAMRPSGGMDNHFRAASFNFCCLLASSALSLRDSCTPAKDPDQAAHFVFRAFKMSVVSLVCPSFMAASRFGRSSARQWAYAFMTSSESLKSLRIFSREMIKGRRDF